jgi:hypothetical protein
VSGVIGSKKSFYTFFVKELLMGAILIFKKIFLSDEINLSVYTLVKVFIHPDGCFQVDSMLISPESGAYFPHRVVPPVSGLYQECSFFLKKVIMVIGIATSP